MATFGLIRATAYNVFSEPKITVHWLDMTPSLP